MASPAVPTAALPPIVMADHGDSLAVLRGSVAGGLPLVAAATLEHAKQLVGTQTPLVLCDCHFDDGRMYDLLRWMKASSRLSKVPFLAIRVLEGELDDAMYESVKIATRALGADGFVDLYRWRQRYGAQQATERLTQRINRLALGEDGTDSDSL